MYIIFVSYSDRAKANWVLISTCASIRYQCSFFQLFFSAAQWRIGYWTNIRIAIPCRAIMRSNKAVVLHLWWSSMGIELSREDCRDLINRYNLATLCASTKSDERWLFKFFDIVAIDDHTCLSFLFIVYLVLNVPFQTNGSDCPVQYIWEYRQFSTRAIHIKMLLHKTPI